MSRFEVGIDGKIISYGYDHALGYFLDIEDVESENISEESSLFTKLTGVKMAEKLRDIEFAIPKEHIEAMMLDLPF